MLEVEPRPPAQQTAKPPEKLRHRRETKLEMRERDLWRLGGERAQHHSECRRILRREPTLTARGERSGAEPEESILFGNQPLAKPFGRSLDPPVLLEPLRELLGGLLRLELVQLAALGEQAARLQLQERRDENEKLAAGVEVELVPFGIDEGRMMSS